MLTKENFIKELKNKNQEAIEFVLDEYGNLIYKIAYMHLGNAELSEECVNEVLIKVWNSIKEFKYTNDKFKNWVGAIAKYTAISIYRKEEKHKRNVEYKDYYEKNQDALIDEFISKKEFADIVNRIQGFNEIDRYIFINRFFIGKSVKEIAKELNLTANAVSLRILKNREKLKKES
ncbi:sigma-70 family RNA polymerase sigma factor [uncultured Clostridium sp.]|uniref:sigma-70 family RNA polymerase sigma factor n=1 Tax=uncultured Clostridium sp. TaxID=59620 RepID=UPI00263903C8|nr:sigma-70 family RNA polymerase sigma factor [uncultured Clostridium sp.]